MRIGLTGTVSCGKTTLVKALMDLPEFNGYEFATERSKYLRDQGIALNTDSTLKGQIVFVKEKFVDLMMRIRNDYDVIFYVSPEGVDIEDNGVRTIDSEYRDKIDYTIREMLKEYPPKRLVEIKGTTDERIQIIKETLFA